MLEKKCFLIFWVPISILLCPKVVTDMKNSLYRVGMGVPTKIKMKNTRPKKLFKIQPPDLLHQQISFYTNLKNFIQYYLKKIFFNGFTQTPVHLFKDRNPLSMMKVFCQCSLIFFGDQTSNATDGTKIHDNIISL